MEAKLWPAVHEILSVVKLLADTLKVAFDHVDVCLVVFVSHTGVSDYANSKFVKAICDFFALHLPDRVVVSVKEYLQVYDRGLLKVKLAKTKLRVGC